MVSGRLVSLNVSTVEAIIDCLNRDMVLGNGLLLGWGWEVLDGVFCVLPQMHHLVG